MVLGPAVLVSLTSVPLITQVQPIAGQVTFLDISVVEFRTREASEDVGVEGSVHLEEDDVIAAEGAIPAPSVAVGVADSSLDG